MGDWADLYEALGYDMTLIPASAYKKKRRPKNISISIKLSKEDAEKYKKLGGAKWIKKSIKEASHDR